MVKEGSHQVWELEFNHLQPQGRREWTLASCLQTSTCALCYTCLCTHTNIHIHTYTHIHTQTHRNLKSKEEQKAVKTLNHPVCIQQVLFAYPVVNPKAEVASKASTTLVWLQRSFDTTDLNRNLTRLCANGQGCDPAGIWSYSDRHMKVLVLFYLSQAHRPPD